MISVTLSGITKSYLLTYLLM